MVAGQWHEPWLQLQFEACLPSDGEKARAPEAWAKLPSPFPVLRHWEDGRPVDVDAP
jgi:hypothetical protein